MNKQCTAFEIFAILKDHYEQYGGLIARSTGPVSTPVTVKLKKKKLTSDNLVSKTGKSKNHYFLMFRNEYSNTETLMQALDQLNQNCNENDKELIQVNLSV